jgi:hypothetical protein
VRVEEVPVGLERGDRAATWASSPREAATCEERVHRDRAQPCRRTPTRGLEPRARRVPWLAHVSDAGATRLAATPDG